MPSRVSWPTAPCQCLEETIDEHRRILDAICAGDAAGANAAMYEHITGSWARRRPAAQADLDSAV